MKKFFIYIFLPMILKSQTNNTYFSSTSLNFNISNINTIQNTSINLTKDTTIIKINSNYLNQIQNNDSFKANEIINSENNFNKNNSDSKLDITTNRKKNLLIGAFIKYNWQKLAPFFESYNKSNFTNCDCVMFVDRVSKNTINKMKNLGIIVLPIPNKYKKYMIINYRWKIYEEFINNNTNKYDLVFTADIRDTFFQQDVFKFFNSSKPFLGVGIEDSILNEKRNKDWLIDAYGEDIYKSIENERIICVGTIWGTPDKFSEFCKLMWDSLKTERAVRIELVDQPPANYLIYYKKLFNDCLVKSENKNGTVMTIGLAGNLQFDSEDNLLNYKGEIASVIHQYDRNLSIVKKVMNKYCPEIAIQIEKEKKIKKFVKCFGVCILILEIIFFIFHLTKKKLKKKPKKSDNNSNKVLKLSNKSKKKADELNTSSLNIINSQTN